MKQLFILLFIHFGVFSFSQTQASKINIDYYSDLAREGLNQIVTEKSKKINEKIAANETIINDAALEKVIFAADKLIEINPSRIDYFTTKTYAYFITNKYDEFMLASEELLKQNNINKGIWYNLNDANKAEYDILLKAYYFYIKEMIPSKNKNGVYYLNMISEQFETYLPKASEKYLIKAWILNRLGNGNLAIKNLEEGRKKFPNDFNILIQLYEYYLTLKENDKLNELKNSVLKQDNQELIRFFEEVIKNYN